MEINYSGPTSEEILRLKRIQEQILKEIDINKQLKLFEEYSLIKSKQIKKVEYSYMQTQDNKFLKPFEKIVDEKEKMVLYMNKRLQECKEQVQNKEKIYQLLKESIYTQTVEEYSYSFSKMHEAYVKELEESRKIIRKKALELLIANNVKEYKNALNSYAAANGFKDGKEKIYYDLDLNQKIIDNIFNSKLVNKLYNKYGELMQKIFNVPNKITYSELLYFYRKSQMDLEVPIYEEEYPKYLNIIFKMYGDKPLEIMQKALNNDQVIYGKKMEVSFCDYIPSEEPFVYLNTQEESTRTLVTFAHEMGHLVQKTIEKENNESLNLLVTNMITELASMLMQLSTWEFFLKNTSYETVRENEAINTINSLINVLIFIPQSAYFELEVFNLNKISSKTLNELQLKTLEEFTIGEKIENRKTRNSLKTTWKNIANLNDEISYIKYCIGAIIAINIIQKIKENPDYVETYLEYQKKPNNCNQAEKLKKYLGIDLENEETYEVAYNYAIELIDSVLQE